MRNLYDYLNDVGVDFSVYTEETLTDKERNSMKKAVTGKKGFSRKKICTAAAAAAVIAALGITSYATGFVDNIIKFVTTGHNQYAQMNAYGEGESLKLPPEIKGLLFDKDGNEAEQFLPTAEYYDADGNKIDDVGEYLESKNITRLTLEDGTVEVAFKTGKNADPLAKHKSEEHTVIVKNMSDLDGKLAFNMKTPDILPEGFDFYGATYNDNGGEYLFLYYMNADGDWFAIHERLINDDTAYATSTDGTIEELDINGHTAVLMDGDMLDWEADGASVSIMGRGYIEKDELIRMAETMQ